MFENIISKVRFLRTRSYVSTNSYCEIFPNYLQQEERRHVDIVVELMKTFQIQNPIDKKLHLSQIETIA